MILLSRTIMSAIFAAIPMVLMLFGITYEVSIEDQTVIVNGVVTLIGIAATMFFRYKAKIDLQTNTPLAPAASKPPDPITPIVIKD